MSRWSEQFNNHPFGSAWTAVKSLALDKELEKSDRDDAIKEIARLNKVIAYVDSVLEEVDPELMPAPTLDAMNKHATNCQNELNSFSSNQNIGHLTNANNHIDQIIILVNQTPFALTGQQKGAMSQAAIAYSEVIDEHLSRLKDAVDANVGDVEGNVSEINTKITKLSASLEELEAEIKTVAQTIEKQSAEFNTQFQVSEKSRSDKFETVAVKLQEKADSEFEKLSVKAGTVLEVLGKFHDDAAKVFGVVVNTLQAGAYSSYANQEKKTANWLRIFAFSLMITGVAILVVPELGRMWADISAYTLDWKNVLGRSFFALILFIPGFYLAKESSRHRNNEIINRRRELILSTIDPYLALLDNDKAEEIKSEIARSIFSEGSLPLEHTTEDAGNLFAQVTNLVKQVQKIGK
ncbi:MAG: hypothetical protein OQK73_00285 [Gammaproteobacteria bacterium]|nr:hypothetical protein [Gammaproteobacteria bacterium]